MRAATFFLLTILLLFAGCSYENKNDTICGYKTYPNGTEEPLYDCPVKISIDIQEVKKMTSIDAWKLNLTSKIEQPFFAAPAETQNQTIKVLAIKSYKAIKGPNQAALKSALNESINQSKKYDLTFRDKYYRIYNFSDVISELENMSFPKYEPDFFDCDDFTERAIVDLKRIFPGAAIGYMSVETNETAHAVMIMFDEKYNVYYVDPQNIDIYNISEIPWDRIREVIL